MSSPEGQRTLQPRKNPERTCRTITEVLAELNRAASQEKQHAKIASRTSTESHDSSSANPVKPLREKKTRGKVGRAVKQQTQADLTASSALPPYLEPQTQTATNRSLSSNAKDNELLVPQKTAMCLRNTPKRQQKGSCRKGNPPSEKEVTSLRTKSKVSNGEPFEQLSICPRGVGRADSAETQEMPQRKAKVKRSCAHRSNSLGDQNPKKTCGAIRTRSAPGPMSTLEVSACPGGSVLEVSACPGGSAPEVSACPGGSAPEVSACPGGSAPEVSACPGGSAPEVSACPGGSAPEVSACPGGSALEVSACTSGSALEVSACTSGSALEVSACTSGSALSLNTPRRSPRHSGMCFRSSGFPSALPVIAESAQSSAVNSKQGELKTCPAKKRQADVLPQKRVRSRKPQVQQKSVTQQKQQQDSCTAMFAKRPRKKAEPPQSTCSHSTRRARPRFELQDSVLHEPEQTQPSDLSIKLCVQEEEPYPLDLSLSLQDEEEEEEEEELPSFLQQISQKPSLIREGLFVWCKLRKYPFWPAIVKSVNHKNKKASIVFIDGLLLDKKKTVKKGFSVSLKTLKPLDCEESEHFADLAKEQYGDIITWCQDLISDYRIRIGCGSFVGSFIEYFDDNISCPVRNKYPRVWSSELTFPSQQLLSEQGKGVANDMGVVEEAEPRSKQEELHLKVLPDRTLAARNRANERLVDFIVKKRKVENRLLAVISGQEPSKWRQALSSSSRSVVEVYLEDEEQVDKVYRYLQKLCDACPKLETTDRIRFILDVLLPEALIYAIAGVDHLSLDKAEAKYRRGPCHSNRERKEFDMMIEQQMKLKDTRPSP